MVTAARHKTGERAPPPVPAAAAHCPPLSATTPRGGGGGGAGHGLGGKGGRGLSNLTSKPPSNFNVCKKLKTRLIDSLSAPSTEITVVHSATGSVPESEERDEEFDESVDYDAMFVDRHVEITDEEEAADGDEEEDGDEDEDGEEDGDEDKEEEEDGAEEGHAVGSKRKLTSIVWVDFKKVKVRGRWKAQCLHCKKKLGEESKNGTKHLHVHLAACTMKKVNSNGKALSQSSLRFSSSGHGKVSVENYTFDQAFARKMLASMIVLHEYPLSMNH